jgi:hypothetical protein
MITMRNLLSRIKNLEKRLSREEVIVCRFSNGDELEMTEKRFTQMFSSIYIGQPNEDVHYFLEQLKNGNEDDNGLVHLIDAENVINDPERFSELWREDL